MLPVSKSLTETASKEAVWQPQDTSLQGGTSFLWIARKAIRP